jgi:ubiquinone/menaquinone biosynthesis C-methylase UbiE
MQQTLDGLSTAYDRIADEYDGSTEHLLEAQHRLTSSLSIAPGDRCLELGCGTGVHALDLAQRSSGGEVVGVDLSSAMLETTRRRAAERGLKVTTVCLGAEEFARSAPAGSFDVITLRFCLGYVDWRILLSELPRLLRPGGRIGILANSSRSGSQAYETYRAMVSDLGIEDVARTTPESLEVLEQLLVAAGGTINDAWSEAFRLWFPSGEEAGRWLRESGHASHPALEALPETFVAALWQAFASRMERHREPAGLPIDFEVLGLAARF